MEKQNENLKDKKRTVLIVICSVALVILIVFILFAITRGGNKTGKTTTDDMKKMRGIFIDNNEIVEGDHYTFDSIQCFDDSTVCIDHLEVIRYGKHGLFIYQLNNHTGSALTGVLRLTLGDEVFLLPYKALPANRSVTQYYGFDGWTDLDISSLQNYSIAPGTPVDGGARYEGLTDEEKEQITVAS